MGGKALVYLENEEVPAEVGVAAANATHEPAVYDVPYWNVTIDKTQPHRSRETYGTMNDKYDTWDTQIKYRK